MAIKRKTKTSVDSRGSAPLKIVPVPKPVPAKEGWAPVRGGRVWYWDTGGRGQAVVFVHPNAGSSLSWAYQQPAFARAGYRAVGYSRRNYYKSDLAPRNDPGIASEDLHDLIEYLGLGQVHMVSAAAGGGVATDYAVSHPDRLRSLAIVSRTAGIRKGPVARAVAALKPPQWKDLPRWFQELGPSYRAANPEGVRRWIEINRKSEARKGGGHQKSANVITRETLAKLAVPTLLMTGTADFTAPPSVVREVARNIPGSELVVVPGAGHSIYWEQPETFNAVVLAFIARHAG